MKPFLLACLFCLPEPRALGTGCRPGVPFCKRSPCPDVLQSLAQLADRNLVVDPDLSGTISLGTAGRPLPPGPFHRHPQPRVGMPGRREHPLGQYPEKLDARFGQLSLHPLEYISAKEAAETLKPLFHSPLVWDRESNAAVPWHCRGKGPAERSPVPAGPSQSPGHPGSPNPVPERGSFPGSWA